MIVGSTRDPGVTGRQRVAVWFAAVTLLGLVARCGLWFGGSDTAADVAWGLTTAIGIGPAVAWVVISLRRHRPGVTPDTGLAGAQSCHSH